jgi:large subunit ribosomal protein L29
MKITELAQKNDAELASFVTDSRRTLAQTVIDARTKEMNNVKALAGIKRGIARALTIQRQRELSNQEQTS